MKHELKSGSGGDPSAKRIDSLAAAIQAGRVAAKRRNERAVIWRAVLISGFAMIAVFVALEVIKPETADPGSGEVEARIEKPATASVKKAMPETVAKVDDSRPAPDSRENIQPLPQPAAPPDEAIAEASEASEAEKIAAEPVLLLAGMDATRDTAVLRHQELLKRVIHEKAWDAYRGLLGKSVKSALATLRPGEGLNRFDSVWSEPALYQSLLRWRTLGWFSESQISSVVNDSYTGGFFIWLLNDNSAMEELLLTMRPADDGGSVLKFLLDAWSVNESQYQKYFPLALACAVVFDEPLSIPHPVGDAEYGVEATVEPLKRYRWYVEKNEKGKLAAPVHHSSARDLIWAVCAPVTTSELEWAIDKLHYRRGKWGSAYGEVEYLMERAVEGLDPYKEYSFAEILKEGGICGDQSYFCVNTARAQGIPAMTLVGETNLGGHAWAGLKTDSREWTTQVGRIGGVSKGLADNPQTRQSITEQEIQLWNDRDHQSPAVTLSVYRHLWLADFFTAMENESDHAETVRLVSRIGRSFTETWHALYSLLEHEMKLVGNPAKPSNFEEWKTFAIGMRREFKDNPRMAALAAKAELEYIFPYSSEGTAKRSLLRERRRIERDSGEQADLITDALKREAELIVKRGEPEAKRDIGRLYDRALRDYGGSITGFKIMAADYFSYFRDDPLAARKVVRDIELAFKRVVETGTKDWFRAKTEAGIYKMICGYYREAGDPARAEMLEKRLEVLLRRAERGAL